VLILVWWPRSAGFAAVLPTAIFTICALAPTACAHVRRPLEITKADQLTPGVSTEEDSATSRAAAPSIRLSGQLPRRAANIGSHGIADVCGMTRHVREISIG
jgi:hypothetical protein